MNWIYLCNGEYATFQYDVHNKENQFCESDSVVVKDARGKTEREEKMQKQTSYCIVKSLIFIDRVSLWCFFTLKDYNGHIEMVMSI